MIKLKEAQLLKHKFNSTAEYEDTQKDVAQFIDNYFRGREDYYGVEIDDEYEGSFYHLSFISDELAIALFNVVENVLDEYVRVTKNRIKSRNRVESLETGLEHSQKYNYQLLGRLKADCDYFLGAGNGAVKYLWADSVEEHITKMRELYDNLKVKPEWITPEDIDSYEEKMLSLN